jgi:hypothetical protein
MATAENLNLASSLVTTRNETMRTSVSYEVLGKCIMNIHTNSVRLIFYTLTIAKVPTLLKLEVNLCLTKVTWSDSALIEFMFKNR